MNKKNAFTFTELMIVLALIGVIASFMIPALVKVEPDETALTYKKVFFAVEEAISSIINDTEKYPWGDLRYNNTAIPDGATGDDITGYQLDNKGTYLCRNLAETMNTVGVIKCPGDDGLTDLKIANDGELKGDNDLTTATTNFTLSNGVSVGGIGANITDNKKNIWNNVNDNTDTTAEIAFITLCVDVNGAAEPNVGCKTSNRAHAKRDQFRIRLNYEGKVYTDLPVGPNNWYLENKMLINPRAVTKDKNPMSSDEKTELVKAAGSDSNPPSQWGQSDCKESLGYIWSNDLCIYTAGYDELTIRRKKTTPRTKTSSK